MPKKPPQRPDVADEPIPEEPKRLERTRPQDDQSVRQKSSGHKKVTADKWNQ
jgi:hypothetical protein